MVERVAGGGDSDLDIFGTGYLDVAHGLFGVRGNDGEWVRADGFAPLAANEKFVI